MLIINFHTYNTIECELTKQYENRIISFFQNISVIFLNIRTIGTEPMNGKFNFLQIQSRFLVNIYQ